MRLSTAFSIACCAATLCGATLTAQAQTPPPASKPSPGDVLKSAQPSDWRDIDPQSLLVMELPAGTVLIELAEAFAPVHVRNIRTLARAGYYDGLSILRVQENYVTQWGDSGDDLPGEKARAKPAEVKNAPVEFDRALRGLALNPLKEPDGWAPKAGFVEGWPVGANPKTGRAWLTHCPSMVGAGRGNEPDSSDGASLYAVIGHAPRVLDLNITTVGRVLQGMEWLTSLPRGTGTLGFYEKASQRTPITRVRLAADIPEAERPKLQMLRTSTPLWERYLDARRHRSGWFVHNPNRVELCGALPPVRKAP